MEKNVVLKCIDDSGDIPLDKNPETVVFTTPSDCKLQGTLVFAQPTPGFTLIGAIPGYSVLYYYYDGTTTIPAAGYPFSYTTDQKGNNGTGVIK
jgi:hypothetical protein